MENQTPNQGNINQQFAQQFGQQPIPNSTAVLVLGIISIVGCICYGIVGLICGIIAVVLAGKATKLYTDNPGLYSEASLKNLKAGKVCGIIGLCISAAYMILLICWFAVIGTALSGMPWENLR
jgi:hypothetical protein